MPLFLMLGRDIIVALLHQRSRRHILFPGSGGGWYLSKQHTGQAQIKMTKLRSSMQSHGPKPQGKTAFRQFLPEALLHRQVVVFMAGGALGCWLVLSSPGSVLVRVCLIVSALQDFGYSSS
jgi:hypothetical protein